jgi:hypothetical protein
MPNMVEIWWNRSGLDFEIRSISTNSDDKFSPATCCSKVAPGAEPTGIISSKLVARTAVNWRGFHTQEGGDQQLH